MDLYLLDSAWQTVAIIDDYTSLIWRRKYSNIGDFELHCASEFTGSLIMAKYVYRPDRPETGIVEQLCVDDSKTIVKGRFLEALLDDYIVYPVQSYKSKTPEYIARDLVNSLTEIPLGASENLGTTTDMQIIGDNLLECIYDMLNAQSLCPRVQYDYTNNTLSFSVWQGKDRRQSQDTNSWAVFSQGWDNLRSSSYIRSTKDYRNFAVVAGEGEGNARTIVTVDLSGNEHARKLWVDARDLRSDNLSATEYTALLVARGKEKLAEYDVVEKFDATIDTTLESLIYRIDYDLGDICTVSDVDNGITLEARLTEIEEAYENGGLTLMARFGDGYLSVPDYIRRRYK